jgi:hypothetical protein
MQSVVTSFRTDFGREQLLQYLDSIMTAVEKKESHQASSNVIEEEDTKLSDCDWSIYFFYLYLNLFKIFVFIHLT